MKRNSIQAIVLVFASLFAFQAVGDAHSRRTAQDPKRAGQEDPFVIDDAEFLAWVRYVLPRESELAWEEIPWLPSFAEGMRAAGERGAPLLLWLMNGHPLGCT